MTKYNVISIKRTSNELKWIEASESLIMLLRGPDNRDIYQIYEYLKIIFTSRVREEFNWRYGCRYTAKEARDSVNDLLRKSQNDEKIKEDLDIILCDTSNHYFEHIYNFLATYNKHNKIEKLLALEFDKNLTTLFTSVNSLDRYKMNKHARAITF